MSKKKPTKKDIETVLSNLIKDVSMLIKTINNLDIAMSEYINYKKDKAGFQEYIDKRLEQVKSGQGDK